MVLICRYVALSDERKEGLVEVGTHENTGAIIEDLESLWPEFSPEFYAPGKVPPHFPIHLEKVVANAMRKAQVFARWEAGTSIWEGRGSGIMVGILCKAHILREWLPSDYEKLLYNWSNHSTYSPVYETSEF